MPPLLALDIARVIYDLLADAGQVDTTSAADRSQLERFTRQVGRSGKDELQKQSLAE